MKTIAKNKKGEILMLISSFLIGGLVMYLFLQNTITKENTIILEKNSMKKPIERIKDATVVIETYTGLNKDSTGSGFVYKKDNKYAYILSNEHVLSGNVIKVINSTEEEIEGRVLGKDPYLDLCVIRVSKDKINQVATIGSSEKTSVGDFIFTIGAPLGRTYQGTVTTGILSGKDRMVETTVDSNSSSYVMKVLQFDASINSGNSGGPLLNAKGEVIGIVLMKLIDTQIEGMGFAIPIEDVMSRVDDLEKGKTKEYPELGITMTNISNSATISNQNIKVPENQKEGVVILSIKEKGPAKDAKLKKGDIITQIEGKTVKDTAYLKYELLKHQVGDKIKITYIRDGKENIKDIKL